MNKEDIKLYGKIDQIVKEYEKGYELKGIATATSRDCFLKQIIDSVKRIKYFERIQERGDDTICIDPSSTAFNPLKAAVYHKRNNNIDEAFWLVFLAVHFGKNLRSGWNLPRQLYNGLGENLWSWNNINDNFDDFLTWLNDSQTDLKKEGGFGNHRKYVSLSATKEFGTGSAIGSYLEWVKKYGSHSNLKKEVEKKYTNDSKILFNGLYGEIDQLATFARMGKFDLLCMIGKLNLITIEPGSLYMNGATGPMAGSKILFGLSLYASEFDSRLQKLGLNLKTPFAMQVLEDAICNWQKSPDSYSLFRG